MYELGVRHALRRDGTILIIDTSRSDKSLFDLQTYRAIEFQSNTLEGMNKLKEELARYASNAHMPSNEPGGNPVHDFLPELPPNILNAALGTEAGQLRGQLQELNDLVLHYRNKYGDETSDRGALQDAKAVIAAALDEAKQGLMPSTIVKSAANAAQSHL